MKQRLTLAAHALQLHGHPRAAWLLASALAVMTARDTEALRLLAWLATENDDRARALSLCREVLERCPEDAEALRVLGHLCLSGGEPAEALAYFERHDRLTVGQSTIARMYRHAPLDSDRAELRVPYYSRLEGVLADTAYWSIMTDAGTVHSADTHGRNLGNSPFVRGRISPDESTVIASFRPPSVEIGEECIFVGGDENYSHWLFRNLLKLCSLEAERLVYTLPWLLNSDLSAFQVEYLDMLGVGPERRVLVDRGQVVRCQRLVVPALLTSRGMIAQGIEWLRERLARFMAPIGPAEELIYVSRRDARWRHVANEDELYARLKPLGFRMIVPGRLSVAEQIGHFSGAKIVVCVHGAALTNMIFTPADAAIIEINSSALARMDDFHRIAQARGQRMVSVISKRYTAPQETVNVNADYYADIEAVVREVERSL